MSNVGKWRPWYKDLKLGDGPRPYGTTDAYRLGAEWLRGCSLVADWGCGMGYFRTFVERQRYWGVDGTYSPFCDEVVDLTEYTSTSDGIFMRGVLEHECKWRDVLRNAVASFRKRMCLVLFTPMSDETKEIKWVEELGVPDISFRHEDIVAELGSARWNYEDIRSDTGYGGERLYYLEK